MREAVSARLDDGTVRLLAARHGRTPADVVASLTRDSLTGSAVPLAAAEVELADGTTVPWSRVRALDADEAF